MKRRKLNVEELNRISIEEFRDAPKIPLVVVLDNVRSRHNPPPDAEIHKTALGAEDSVKWRYFAEPISAIKELKKNGYAVFSIEQTRNSLSLETLKLDRQGRYAVVLGHEVHGVQQEVVDASDNCIEIPQYGTKHSLNVSVAAGIVIWDFFKQLSE